MLSSSPAVSSSLCSSGFSNIDTVTSKVIGIYATNNSDDYHYVILDKYNCSVDEGGKSAYVDFQTRNNHYLQFSKNDSFMQFVLLTAHATDQTVKFRLGSGKHGYNSILYVIAPHDAKQ